MSNNQFGVEYVKRNFAPMLIGLLVCGLAGYFLGGSDGRSLGSGVGAALGLIVGGLVSKPKK